MQQKSKKEIIQYLEENVMQAVDKYFANKSVSVLSGEEVRSIQHIWAFIVPGSYLAVNCASCLSHTIQIINAFYQREKAKLAKKEKVVEAIESTENNVETIENKQEQTALENNTNSIEKLKENVVRQTKRKNTRKSVVRVTSNNAEISDKHQ